MRFKQWALIRLLVAEKKSVTSICKRLKKLIGVNGVDKSTVSRWASRIAGCEKGQAEPSDVRRSGRPTTAGTLTSLKMLMSRPQTMNSDLYVQKLKKLAEALQEISTWHKCY
jgi:ABC-type enterochelin transport system ATPase subunit